MMCVLFEDDGVEVRGGGDLYKLGGRSMKVREQWPWTRLAVIAHQSLRDGIDLDTVSPGTQSCRGQKGVAQDETPLAQRFRRILEAVSFWFSSRKH